MLFTPRSVDGLPGLRFPAAGPTFPGKEEVVSYLERYTAHFSLPVRYATRITALRREDDAFAAVSAAGDTYSTRQVVVATGPYQKRRVPRFAADLPSDIVQARLALSQALQLGEETPYAKETRRQARNPSAWAGRKLLNFQMLTRVANLTRRQALGQWIRGRRLAGR